MMSQPFTSGSEQRMLSIQFTDLCRLIFTSYLIEKHMEDSSTAKTTKKKTLSALQKRKNNSEKGRKGADTRGVGLGARQDVVLPSKWEQEVVQVGSSKEKVVYVSPSKTRYNQVQTKSSCDESLHYMPTPEKKSQSHGCIKELSEPF